MRSPYSNFFRNLKRATTYYRPPKMETDARLGHDPLYIHVPRSGKIEPTKAPGDAFDRIVGLAWPGCIALLAGLFVALFTSSWPLDPFRFTSWVLQTALAFFAFAAAIIALRTRESRWVRFTAAFVNLIYPAVLVTRWLGML